MKIDFSIQKWTPREKKIGIVTILMLLALISYHGVFRPTALKMSQADEEIFALQMKLRKSKTFIRQRDEVLEAAKRYPNLEHMNARKDEEEIASLLNFIEQSARKTGVALSDVKPQEVKSDKVSKFYVIELTAESVLKQMIEFAFELQHSEQLLNVEQIEMAPKEEGSTVLRSFIVISRAVVE